MRRTRICSLLLLITVTAIPLLAKAGSDAPQAASTQVTADTRIEADDSADVIRFIVAGREVARLTSEGFIVRDDLRFGGMVNDIGDGNYDAAIAPTTKEAK